MVEETNVFLFFGCVSQRLWKIEGSECKNIRFLEATNTYCVLVVKWTIIRQAGSLFPA